MSDSSFLAQLSWSELLGAIIVFGGGCYLLFLAVDGLALPQEQSLAIVTDKEHQEAKQTQETELIGGRTRVIPRVIPEKYLLKLSIRNRLADGSVSRSVYEGITPGDQVFVTYQRHRLTGSVEVTNVDRNQ
jgi:hypothetical protein